MAIIQKNLYLPGQDLTNLAQNVDYNRLGLDRCNITVDFGVSPAEVTIKQGSLIEVNGNLYAIEAADYVFAMANAAHNYITFTDNPLPAFSSAAAIGTYNNAKLGLYNGTNLIRTLRWYIDQVKKYYQLMIDSLINDISFITSFLDHVRVKMSGDFSVPNSFAAGIVPFNTLVYSWRGKFNTATYLYVVEYTGYYLINFVCTFVVTYGITAGSLYINCMVAVNGSATVNNLSSTIYLAGTYANTVIIKEMVMNTTLYLTAGDTIGIHVANSGGGTAVLRHKLGDILFTALTIDRLL